MCQVLENLNDTLIMPAKVSFGRASTWSRCCITVYCVLLRSLHCDNNNLFDHSQLKTVTSHSTAAVPIAKTSKSGFSLVMSLIKRFLWLLGIWVVIPLAAQEIP